MWVGNFTNISSEVHETGFPPLGLLERTIGPAGWGIILEGCVEI